MLLNKEFLINLKAKFSYQLLLLLFFFWQTSYSAAIYAKVIGTLELLLEAIHVASEEFFIDLKATFSC